MNDEADRYPGLLGVAMSGAGSTMIAFATDNLAEIANEMRNRFSAAGAGSRTLQVEVNNGGRTVRSSEC
jgi:homoserine kinase